MPGSVHDPVSRASYEFTPEGENLYVETWMEPGGGLPPHEHPRQTEVWYVIDGKVEFRAGQGKARDRSRGRRDAGAAQHRPRCQGRGGHAPPTWAAA